jgi:hypothetical protein
VYEKHPGSPSVHERGEDPYVAIVGVESLLSLVQIGVLEIHVWGCTLRAESTCQVRGSDATLPGSAHRGCAGCLVDAA